MCRLDLKIPDKEQGVCGVSSGYCARKELEPAQVFRRGRMIGRGVVGGKIVLSSPSFYPILDVLRRSLLTREG